MTTPTAYYRVAFHEACPSPEHLFYTVNILLPLATAPLDALHLSLSPAQITHPSPGTGDDRRSLCCYTKSVRTGRDRIRRGE